MKMRQHRLTDPAADTSAEATVELDVIEYANQQGRDPKVRAHVRTNPTWLAGPLKACVKPGLENWNREKPDGSGKPHQHRLSNPAGFALKRQSDLDTDPGWYGYQVVDGTALVQAQVLPLAGA